MVEVVGSSSFEEASRPDLPDDELSEGQLFSSGSEKEHENGEDRVEEDGYLEVIAPEVAAAAEGADAPRVNRQATEQSNLEHLQTQFNEAYTSKQEKPAASAKQDEDDGMDWKRSLEGEFDLRSGFGQKFQRFIRVLENKKEQDEFVKKQVAMGMKVNPAKKLFRAEWAKKRFEETRAEKNHTKSYETVKREHGEYMVFARVVEKLGWVTDQEGAVRRALAYCNKCFEMGGEWVDRNELHGDLEFFFLKKQSMTDMAEKWSLFESERTKGEGDSQQEDDTRPSKPSAQAAGAASAASSSGGAQAAKPKVAPVVPKAKAKEKELEPVVEQASTAGAGKEAKTEAARSAEEKKKVKAAAKSGLSMLVANCNKLKQKNLTTTAAARNLIQNIQDQNNQQTWGWANNEQHVGQLELRQKQLNEKMSSDLSNLMIRVARDNKSTSKPLCF